MRLLSENYSVSLYSVLDSTSHLALVAHLDSCFPEANIASEDRLPRIALWSGWIGSLVTGLAGAEGITVGRHVFLGAAYSQLSLDLPALEQLGPLLIHEAAHVWQYRRDGTLWFVHRYLSEFISHLLNRKSLTLMARYQAYLAISYEVEARIVEERWLNLQPYS